MHCEGYTVILKVSGRQKVTGRLPAETEYRTGILLRSNKS